MHGFVEVQLCLMIFANTCKVPLSLKYQPLNACFFVVVFSSTLTSVSYLLGKKHDHSSNTNDDGCQWKQIRHLHRWQHHGTERIHDCRRFCFCCRCCVSKGTVTKNRYNTFRLVSFLPSLSDTISHKFSEHCFPTEYTLGLNKFSFALILPRSFKFVSS